MQRLIALVTVIIFGLLLSTVLAQNFIGGPAPAPTAPTVGSPAPTGQVMTTEQFKSTVNSLGKQTDANLSQQVDDSLAAGAKSMPAPPSSVSSQPSPPTTGSDTPPDMPAPPTNTAPPPVAKLPPRPAPSTTVAPPPSTTEVYTGFGGAQANPKNSNTNTGGNSGNAKSGNWNVGY